MTTRQYNKKYRRLIYLIRHGRVGYSSFGLSEPEFNSVSRPEFDEIIAIANELGLDKNELCELSMLHRFDKLHAKRDRSKMPKPDRRDNKHTYSHGTGNGFNRNRVRYPRKCRKAAWKRFYKLFPHLKPVEGQ